MTYLDRRGPRPHRTLNRLTTGAIRDATGPCELFDGGGLMLRIGATGRGGSWVLRFMLRGRSREMGLGPAKFVTLAEARAKARAARDLLRRGVDPLQQRQARQREAAAARVTFHDAAEAHIRRLCPIWKNGASEDQWRGSLAKYAAPVIGHLMIGDIEPGHILKIVTPIWRLKHVTAARVLNRIQAVLAYAIGTGQIPGPNPADSRAIRAALPRVPGRPRPRRAPFRMAVMVEAP